jgi:hypothetical protein
VLLDGTWLDERTPLAVKRASLPTWDPEAMSQKLRAFVDKAAAAGELSECGPYRGPPPKPAYEYGEIDIATNPDSWDPCDARRLIEGLADRVRELRREASAAKGLTNSGPPA